MNVDSQFYESFAPVYDAIPEKWEEAREFLTETLKQVTNATNLREIGWYLDTQLLTGKSFIPSLLSNTSPDEYRQIFRMVILVGPVTANMAAIVPHNIIFDDNFTLIQMWASVTNITFAPTPFTALTVTGNNVTMDAMNVSVTSPITADRCVVVIEYLLEI